MRAFEDIKKVLENSSIYYLITIDMEGNYSYLNNHYQEVFNNIHGSLVGRNFAITMHTDDIQTCITVSQKAFEAPDKVFPAIIRKHDGKGGFVITRWEYKAMFSRDGIPAGMFCIGHDITEQVEKSEMLENTIASLEKTKLSLKQIAYMQSHGIRKPLANILGLCSIIESSDLDFEDKKLFDMITVSAKELDILIKHIINYPDTK